MKLLTKAIARKLPRLGTTDGMGLTAPVVVKFFTPDSSWTWYATEGEQEPDGDWRFFGYADDGAGGGELGYFVLSELKAIRGKMGLPVERDQWFDGHTLADVRGTGRVGV